MTASAGGAAMFEAMVKAAKEAAAAFFKSGKFTFLLLMPNASLEAARRATVAVDLKIFMVILSVGGIITMEMRLRTATASAFSINPLIADADLVTWSFCQISQQISL